MNESRQPLRLTDKEAVRDLEGAYVHGVDFLGNWAFLHLTFRGTDDGAAVVKVPIGNVDDSRRSGVYREEDE